MKLSLAKAFAFISITLLTACGGGGSPSPTETDIQTNQLVITSIEADRLMYTKPTAFTIQGHSLDKGLTINSKNCKGLALLAGGTSNKQVITCTIGAVGKALCCH